MLVLVVVLGNMVFLTDISSPIRLSLSLSLSLSLVTHSFSPFLSTFPTGDERLFDDTIDRIPPGMRYLRETVSNKLVNASVSNIQQVEPLQLHRSLSSNSQSNDGFEDECLCGRDHTKEQMTVLDTFFQSLEEANEFQTFVSDLEPMP